FEKNIDQLNVTFFTLGKIVWQYLKEKNFDQLEVEAKWKLFSETIQYLEKPKYFVLEKSGRLIFSLLPIGKIFQEFDDPIKAIDWFADKTTREQFLYDEKKDFLQNVNTRLKNSENYVFKSTEKLNELEHDRHYQLWADLIMANLHTIKQGQDKVLLNSFY